MLWFLGEFWKSKCKTRVIVAHWIGWIHRYISSTIAITNWLTVSQMAMKLSPGTYMFSFLCHRLNLAKKYKLLTLREHLYFWWGFLWVFLIIFSYVHCCMCLMIFHCWLLIRFSLRFIYSLMSFNCRDIEI